MSVVERLVAVARAVLEARADMPQVEASLAEILPAVAELDPASPQYADLSLFVDELMRDHIIPDALPLRAAALARIAWRTQRALSESSAVRLGLLAAHFLEQRDSIDAARELVELVERDARLIDHPVLDAVIALRVHVLADLKNFADADRVVAEYESAPPQHRHDCVEVHLFWRGAEAAYASGHLDVALARARRAVNLAAAPAGKAAGDADAMLNSIFKPLGAGPLYSRVGDVLRLSSDHFGAIDAYEEGRARALESGDRRGAAWCLSEIAITWEQLSEFERARRLLEQAAWEAEQVGDLKAAARWRGQHVPGADGTVDMTGVNGLATIAHRLSAEGPSEELEDLTLQLIKRERGTGTTIEPMARNLLAAIFDAARKYELALSAVMAAVAVADRLKQNWLALSFRCNQAQMLYKLNFWDSARRLCDRILSDADRLLAEAHTSEIRQATIGAVAVATEISLVMASLDGEHESGRIQPRDPERALSIVDRTQGRTLNRWLALMSWSRACAHPELVTASRALIAADIVIEWTAFAVRPVGPALEKRARAEQTWKAVAAAAAIAVPQFQDAGPFPDLTTDAPPRTRILSLSAIASGVVCLCLEGGRPMRIEHISWNRKQRAAWLERLQSAQAAEVARLTEPAAEGSSAEEADQLEKLYSELSGVFVDPLVNWLGHDTDHLIVAMHAELASIPIWAVARAVPDVAISVVPTLRSIAVLRARPPSAGGVDIVVGDATRTLRLAPREAQLLGFASVVPEVAELERVVPGAHYVHFVGHGEFDSDNPYSSGLVLLGVNRPPLSVATTSPGCVRLAIAGIVAGLDLTHCELVTLSACSVGTPRAHAASEFTSVPTSFLLAGARNVIAAGWQVHDAAATVLMSYFYSAMNGNVSRALATARQRLAQCTREEAIRIVGRDDVIPPGDRPFQSPFFTDAFAHYGV